VEDDERSLNGMPIEVTDWQSEFRKLHCWRRLLEKMEC